MVSKVEKHFDNIAQKYDFYKKKNQFYYDNLKLLLTGYIPKNSKLFEVGCGTGDLISYLSPSDGWGMDISSKMIEHARHKYRKNKRIQFSTHWPNQKYDYIFMADVIEHLQEPIVEFKKISKHLNKNSIFICTMANPFWEPLLIFWETMGWKMPEGPHKRIMSEEISILFKKSGLKILKHDYKLLVPIKIPFITNFANKYLESFLKKFCFIEYFIVSKS